MIDRLLDSLGPETYRINITGFGEPTIGSQYLHLLEKLVKRGIIPVFNTNTSTLNIGHIELLVNAQAQVTLSIDGASRETFETIRAGGNWDRLQSILYKIQRVRSVYGHGSSGWWGITFVAVRMNIHELPEMVRLARRFDFDQLLVHDYYPVGSGFDDQSLRHDPETANRTFEESEKLAGDLQVELLIPSRYHPQAPPPNVSQIRKLLSTKRILPKPGRFPQRCNQPWVSPDIDYSGKVTPCCFSTRPLGDLNHADLNDIWNGWRYRWFRRRIDSFMPPPECRDCHVHEGINQGNPGNAKMGEGILLKVLYKIEWIAHGLILKVFSTKKDDKTRQFFFKGKLLKPGKGPESSA